MPLTEPPSSPVHAPSPAAPRGVKRPERSEDAAAGPSTPVKKKKKEKDSSADKEEKRPSRKERRAARKEEKRLARMARAMKAHEEDVDLATHEAPKDNDADQAMDEAPKDNHVDQAMDKAREDNHVDQEMDEVANNEPVDNVEYEEPESDSDDEIIIGSFRSFGSTTPEPATPEPTMPQPGADVEEDIPGSTPAPSRFRPIFESSPITYPESSDDSECIPSSVVEGPVSDSEEEESTVVDDEAEAPFPMYSINMSAHEVYRRNTFMVARSGIVAVIALKVDDEGLALGGVTPAVGTVDRAARRTMRKRNDAMDKCLDALNDLLDEHVRRITVHYGLAADTDKRMDGLSGMFKTFQQVMASIPRRADSDEA